MQENDQRYKGKSAAAVWFVLIACLGLAAACGPETKHQSAGAEIVLLPPGGDTCRLQGPARRVLCLSPALTEMYASIADTIGLVGVTPHCNYPAHVAGLPKVQVYPFSLESVLAVQPQLVLTEQGMTSPQHIARIKEMGIPVLHFTYTNLADLWQAIRVIGQATGHEAKANQVADSLALLEAQLQAQMPQPPKTTLVLIGAKPIYAYGRPTLMTRKLQLAGLTQALPDSLDKPYPQISLEGLLALDPEVILGFSKTYFDSVVVAKHPHMAKLQAFRNNMIWPLNDDLASRPSPRAINSVLEMRQAVYGK